MTLEDKAETGNGKVNFTDLNLIKCTIKKPYCEVRGNYFKCYFDDYKTCRIYNSWKEAENGRD